ncbi:MAG: beta-ketothiolase BktB [SAR324 cluster bacterium]|nr:beta-ketothiolase BktB [SAR324 cluster bacterium]
MSNSNREVVLVSGVRTPIGDYGGSLAGVSSAELATLAVKGAMEQGKVDPNDVDQVIIGNVVHSAQHDMYISRVAAINAGIPQETPAYTLNRLCGSGMQSIVNAAQCIMLGDADVAVAGGVESMSNSQYWLPGMRWGQRMMDGKVIDAMVAALNDPFDRVHMGLTAEAVAKKYDISREDQDALAVESHQRAAKAAEAGLFKSQMVPVVVKQRKKETTVDYDEHVRGDATVEGMGKLRPAFDKEGSVTAGNASGINDAAAAVVLMAAEVAEAKGLKPMARLKAYSHSGVDPKIMGIGPIPACEKIFAQTGLNKDDMDVIELNEAFAAQALACVRGLKMESNNVNPNGSGISLGHPIGATGAILVVKAMHELQRIDGKYALNSMCIGGGQGIATMLER